MKKFMSLVLALVMVMAMMVPAMAAMEGTLTGGSITINDAIEGQTYRAYQILYLESYNADAEAYAYKANSEWAGFVNSDAIKGVYLNVDAQGYVTWVTGANVAEFAKLAQAQLNGKTADATAKAESTTVTLSGLNLGYYLVDTTLGTLCSLDTTNPTVVMEEKNEAPTVEKEVQEDSNSEWGTSNDADINQVVNFKATITVKAGAENYVLHDTMSNGLTFDSNSVVVTVGGETVADTNYTVTTPGATCTNGCTFEVAFTDSYIATLAANTEIVVEYSATLNENAVVGLDGNKNEVILEYGDATEPSYTPKDETITYTWDAKVVKYTTKEGAEVTLAGATFKLSTDEQGNNTFKFHALGENKYEVCADANCEKDHVTTITTDATGTFSIEGLDAGTYYLTETAAPAGYNKLAGPVTVTITGATEKDGVLTYNTVETKVENNAGTELPSTGGMGTTMMYIGGGLLVAFAVIMLATKRRMNAAE